MGGRAARAAVLATLSLVAAAPAAGATVTVRTTVVSIPTSSYYPFTGAAAETHDVFAPCAPGERAVGGGWSSPQSNAFTSVDDHPVTGSTGEGWLMRLQNFGRPANAGVSAVCVGGAAAADVAVRTAAQVVNPTTFSFDGQTFRLEERDFFTPCATGEKAIAGGWSSTQPGPFAPNVLAVEDQPAGPESFQGEAWNIRLQNFSTQQALATTYAVCVKGATAASIVLRRSEGMLPPDFASHDFYSGCAPGEHVLSGGWAAEPGANGLVFSLDDNPTGTENFGVETWHVKLFHFFIDRPIRVSVFAFCTR